MEESLREYPFICGAFKEKNAEFPRCFYFVDINNDNCDGMYFVPYIIGGKQNKRTDPDFLDFLLRADNLYVIFSNQQLDCASAFFERPYESYDAFVQEFKDKAARYLPTDFDWDMHIGSFSYAAYAVNGRFEQTKMVLILRST